jgi:hypothetical protein
MASADPVSYLAASGVSAVVTFPLWKAATIGQSAFALESKSPWLRYWEAVKPPWTGGLAVVMGMTWARAAIFVGAEEGKQKLQQQGYSSAVAATLPPLLIATCVSVVNQPFVRSTVTLQDPQCVIGTQSVFPNLAVMRHLISTHGVGSLWLGTNASILKTAPKFMVAIAVKDVMEKLVAVEGCKNPSNNRAIALARSAEKAMVAGAAGAILTNPLDVARNEMFKTNAGLLFTYRRLCREEGLHWLLRGCEKNLLAVAAPIAGTIFMADIFSAWLRGQP